MKVHIEIPPSRIIYEGIKKIYFENGYLNLETKDSEILRLYNVYLSPFFDMQIEEEDNE